MSNAVGRREAEDAELVGRARAGGRDAFATLVRRHAPMARSLAGRVLGDPDLAQEAVQEATLLAWLSLDRLRCPARFGSWLCGIALNLSRRCLRERRRLVLTSDPDELGADRPGADPYGAVEIAALVGDAVSRLPAGQRAATQLFYWQGLTHAEVATELGVSIGAVKNRLHAARAALAAPLALAVDDQEVCSTVSVPVARQWIEVTVAEIRRGDVDDPMLLPHVMLLRERDGDRAVPVWIGAAEATALALSLQTTEMPRPMTYQFIVKLLSAANARVREVRITRLVAGTFYAVVLLDGPGGVAEVDARPSDAVNLAVVTEAPVMVGADLLEDTAATGRAEWQAYPTTGQELVDEVRRAQREMSRRLASGQRMADDTP